MTKEQGTTININETSFRRALDVSWAYIEFNVDGTIDTVNDFFVKIFGYSSPDEIIGQHHRIFCLPEYANSKEYNQFWEELAKGKPQSGEFERKSKNGNEVWINASYTPVFDDEGNVIKVMKIASDITERKLIAKRFRKALDVSWAYCEFSIDGLIEKANNYFVNLLGYYSKEEIIGQHHRIFCNNEYSKSEEYREFWEILKQGEPHSGEFKRVTKQGDVIWINASYTPMKDDSGKVLKIMKIASNITDMVIQRQEVATTKNKLELALDAGNTSLWEIDLETTKCTFDNNFVRLSGYTLDELPKYMPESELLFKGEQYDIMADNFVTAIKNRDTNYYLDLELTKKDNSKIWIRNFIHISYEGNRGKTLYGASHDITKQKNYEKELEKNVRIRTAELKSALEQLKSSQDKLIESEKMASLGQLIAGIAHEINTPMGAIKASVENLIDLNQSTSKRIQFMMDNELSDEEWKVFHEFVNKSLLPIPSLSTREERKVQREIRRNVEALDISDSAIIADYLGDMLFSHDLEPFLPILKRENNAAIIEIALALFQQHKNSNVINQSVDKSRKIVFALKSFSRVDYTGELIETDIRESIDTVIVLYENQLKNGVEVQKRYDESVPKLLVIDDAINQVWTNLIHNAIHAMDNKGILTIFVKNLEKDVQVIINDNGKGIPEDIKDRIFQPFFTTKSRGEGSGLGLDIVSKIVKKHGGSIKVESEPGNTSFYVTLPKKEFIHTEIEKISDKIVVSDEFKG